MAKLQDRQEEFQVENLGNSKFRLNFFVYPRFYGLLIGKKGQIIKPIEWKTKTKTIFPKRQENEPEDYSNKVSIIGRSEDDVLAARMQFESLMNSQTFRSQIHTTHFVCARVTYAVNIRDSLERLKEAILSENYEGIDEGLFKNNNRIDITCTFCSLVNIQDADKAIQIFEECCDELIRKAAPIEVKVHGLYKNDEEPITEVRDIFAGTESQDLLEFSKSLNQRYRENQLTMTELYVLHMKILSCKFRKRITPGSPDTFDATNILEKFSDFDFGTFVVKELHLSRVSTDDGTGFYKALHKVVL